MVENRKKLLNDMKGKSIESQFKLADILLSKSQMTDKVALQLGNDLKKRIAKRHLEWLRSRLSSKEEKELERFSVELGRKAKKGSFKKLLSRLSKEEREELLK